MAGEVIKFIHLNSFTGGLNTYNPVSELSLAESPDLDGIILSAKGFHKRTGDVALNSSAMNGGTNVQGLAWYKPTSGTDYLIAVCGNKIYQSTSFGATMTDITGSLTITGNQNNIWSFTKQNDLVIGVGGAPDAPFSWSGTGDAVLLAGSPPTGTACFSMRDRVFIISGSTVYWCILANCLDWTGTGSGNNAAVTNDGDQLVAGISLNSTTAILFKNFSIHQMTVESAPFPIRPIYTGYGACGTNAVVRGPDGLIYFITKEPRMRSTDGFNVQEYSININDIWDSLNKDRLAYIQGVYVPVLNQIHWYCSSASSNTNDLCIIWDLYNQCWLRYTTGFKANAACVASGYRLFCGHYDGKIYEKFKAGVYTDASEASPGAIKCYWRLPWVNHSDNITLMNSYTHIGNNMMIKHLKWLDINFKTQTSGSIAYSYGFDYNSDSSSGAVSQMASGGEWDVDTWDGSFIWGGAGYNQKRIQLYGRGNNFQLKIENSNASEAMEINSIDIALKEEGVKEFGTA